MEMKKQTPTGADNGINRIALAVLVAVGAVSAMDVCLTIFLIGATLYGAAIPFGIWLLLSWLIRGFCEGNSNLPQGDNPHLRKLVKLLLKKSGTARDRQDSGRAKLSSWPSGSVRWK